MWGGRTKPARSSRSPGGGESGSSLAPNAARRAAVDRGGEPQRDGARWRAVRPCLQRSCRRPQANGGDSAPLPRDREIDVRERLRLEGIERRALSLRARRVVQAFRGEPGEADGERTSGPDS